MTTELQREAMATLAEVWKLSPDIRLGQLLAHLGFLGEAHFGRGLGYLEDDEILAIICRHRSELLARLEGEPNLAARRSEIATSVSGSPMLVDAASAAELGH